MAPAPDPLHRLHDDVRSYCTSFEAAQSGPAEWAEALALLAGIEKAAASLGSVLAAKIAASRAGRLGHARQLNEAAFARRCALQWGVSPAEAAEAIATGGRMASQPEVLRSALDGQLSRAQAGAISAAAELEPSFAAYLVGPAAKRPLGALRDECDRLKAEARRQGAPAPAGAPASGTAEPPGAGRALRTWVDRKGRWHLRASGPVHDGKVISAAIAYLARELPASTPGLGGTDGPTAAGAFDALVAMAAQAAPEQDMHNAPPGPVWPKPRRASRHKQRPLGLDLAPDSLDWLFCQDGPSEVGREHASPAGERAHPPP